MHLFFFSSRRRHTILQGDWSSDVCSSDLRANLDRMMSERRRVIVERRLHAGHHPIEVRAMRRVMKDFECNDLPRSEERRVGKEGRNAWPEETLRQKTDKNTDT